ncbi:MAG TPA: type 1 glutamine amidotransferase domain-containing protein [Sulfuriferula sp.]|nr:type 1 glutamine amidotransferase domain-containing protein [Sulfuriferula sp.]
MAKVLFILTAASELPLKDGNHIPTGFWAQEFVPPHHIFLEHGHTIDIATPKGKPAVLDESCFAPAFHNHDAGRIANLREQLSEIEAWRTPLSLERLALTGARYDALFFPGGYGPMVDLINSEAAGNLVKRTLASGGLIGAVCHGPAGLVMAQQDGHWLFAGYRLTCFSPQEEQLAGLADALPELLAERLASLGGELHFGAPGSEHVVIDRQLHTGQNPASVDKLAFAMARRLKKMGSLDKDACGTPCS